MVSVAVAAGTVGVLLELAGVQSAVVSILVLVFIVVAPIAAIAGLLRGFDVFARIILAAVTAAAGITLIAMIMLVIGAWSVKGGLVAIAIGSAACLLVQQWRAGRLWSSPAMRRLQGNLTSSRITQVSDELAARMARLAAGRRRGAPESQVAPDPGQVAGLPGPECGTPKEPGTPEPEKSAPGTQSLRLGSPPVIMPVPPADSEATQI